ncbi:hypothetical protein [Arenicella chitinivorans]|uniref:hypothetical protein n=1 Tax=Arenicella chitinivorans TaxID=1329800 RepID=UPI00167232F5|nr:hypothetical protein [Arenicella chitinivorans]
MASTNKLLGNESDRVSIEAAKVATAQMDGKQKRVVQHKHWMQVMGEGQSTPDKTYQRSKSN